MSAREPFVVTVCAACDRTAYPPRAACAGCWASDWRQVVVAEGVLDNVTILRRVAGVAELRDVALGVVRLDSGNRVIARIKGHPALGSAVTLSLDEGAVLARPSKNKIKKWWKGA
ncbi:Zn-ribbon domain-containing OB-fold protein [Streptomyces malaysiensis]|uniref:3-hydroxybutyryl-CoA epimerase n=1 Tax=Streptomyces malaysiensis TaxID=92644 RepID=A0A7X6B0S7_STRMQ|nr:zinc ribbon domain-containing protein [Streptomyces malaysiensis]NIY69428.1 3-hydroxybutyryl-CoA epimerase [Streptomyces malaysiensis]